MIAPRNEVFRHYETVSVVSQEASTSYGSKRSEHRYHRSNSEFARNGYIEHFTEKKNGQTGLFCSIRSVFQVTRGTYVQRKNRNKCDHDFSLEVEHLQCSTFCGLEQSWIIVHREPSEMPVQYSRPITDTSYCSSSTTHPFSGRGQSVNSRTFFHHKALGGLGRVCTVLGARI